MTYRFIERYHKPFGLRRFLWRLSICLNTYYNYRKHQKAAYYAHNPKIQNQITKFYQEHDDLTGYRNMTVYLKRKIHHYRFTTIHNYMNTDFKFVLYSAPEKARSGALKDT